MMNFPDFHYVIRSVFMNDLIVYKKVQFNPEHVCYAYKVPPSSIESMAASDSDGRADA